jgi:folate-binding protein YgfZ
MDLAPTTAPAPSLAQRLDAALSGAAFGPPLARGLVRLTGRQRLAFLHRMSTQQLASLQPGDSARLAFLDAKARVLGEGTVVAREDEALLDVDAAALPELLAHLRRYVLRDDVKLEPLDAELRVVTLLGPRSADAARALAGSRPAWPSARYGVPAWDAVVSLAAWDELRRSLGEGGAVELSEEDLEVLRILAGVPRWGAEVDATRLVMETGLTAGAVSFEKGCYLGQEIVLRGTFRGQIQRGLVQLDLPAGVGPGARLRAGEAEVGVVTSAADAPAGRVGLGYLRRAHWAPGTRLATDGGEAVVRRALVTEKDR